MMCNPNMREAESDADFCRRMGWTTGTYLAGDEGYGETVIQLTAVGERAVLAKGVTQNGAAVRRWSMEGLWTLTCREWREVSAPPLPSQEQQGCE